MDFLLSGDFPLVYEVGGSRSGAVCVKASLPSSLPPPGLTVSCFWGWDPVDSDTETPLSAWFPPADEQGHVQLPVTCLSRPPAALHRDAPPPYQGEGDKNRPGRDGYPPDL